ncbi:MAG: hypothetical protein WBK08_03610 [Nitrospira sp.]
MQGALSVDGWRQSWASWLGYAQHADTYGLRRAVRGTLVLQWREKVPPEDFPAGRGRVDDGCAPWGVVEQSSAEPAIREPEQQQADESEQQYRVPMREDSARE